MLPRRTDLKSFQFWHNEVHKNQGRFFGLCLCDAFFSVNGYEFYDLRNDPFEQTNLFTLGMTPGQSHRFDTLGLKRRESPECQCETGLLEPRAEQLERSVRSSPPVCRFWKG